MLELLVLILYLWLFAGALRLAFRVTWGAAKLVAVVLFVLAWPLLIGCLLMAGGLLLLLPLLPVAAACIILKSSL